MSRIRTLAAVGLIVAVSAGAAGDDQLTLENLFANRLFDSTTARDVIWFADGSAVLARDRVDGVDGLWRHDVDRAAPRLVANWDRLSDQLSRLRPGFVEPPMDDVNSHPRVGRDPAISPDGRYYLATGRGDLYLLDLAGGGARFLTNDTDQERFATFSPDGRRVAFARRGDLYVVSTETGVERRLTDGGAARGVLTGVADWVSEEELDVTRSFWWSPDGGRILFVEYDTSAVPLYPITDELELVARVEWQRYPKAGQANASLRLGVVDVEDGRLKWIATGVGDGYLARAGWLPGGRGVWFVVLNRAQTRLELRVATPGEATSRMVIAEEDAAWVNLGDEPLFVDGERFVWTSERDGWRHLYLYQMDGSLVHRLTRGGWQVERLYGLDASRSRVLFQATAADPRERHVLSVDLDGGEPAFVVEGAGTHEAVLSPDGRHFVDEFASIDRPPRLELYDSGGRRLRTLDDGRIPALDGIALAPPEFGSIAAEDGTRLSTSMYRPPDFDADRRYPALVYVYGGPHAQTVVNDWGGTRHLFFRLLARRGLIVFCLDNRGSWGRGHAFETAIHRRLGEVELADQLCGVNLLRSLPYVDADRIGVYGGSYGGYMALLAMNRAPELFAAGIAYAPVTDWRLYDSIYTERYMGMPADNPDGYRDSAPLASAGGLQGALLLCHGMMDNNVHLQHTVQMIAAYTAAGKTFELMLYPRVRHGIRLSDQRLHFHKLKLEFLERHLLGPPRR